MCTMVDATLPTSLFNWDPNTKAMDILEDKKVIDLDDTTDIQSKQNILSLYLTGASECETSKSPLRTSSPESCSKSPKSEITLNALQHEQQNLIEQRIQDRATTLRNMANPLSLTWPSFNTFATRPFPNLVINGQGGTLGLTTNPTTSCMLTTTRTVPWFNRPNINTADPWSIDYTQDPTMRSRPCFSSHQTRELEREFLICQYVTRRRRIELAYSLNLSEKQIKTWFQNRRVKERKQKKCANGANSTSDMTIENETEG